MRSATKNKTGKDEEYLDWIRSLPCCICVLYKSRQLTRTEAAHVGERGFGQKCPDRETLPMCGGLHHREGPHSHHKLGRRFFVLHALDRDVLIAELNSAYDSRE